MKKREILLVIAVIAFGIIYNSARSGDIRFYSGCSHDSRNLLDRKHPVSFPQEEIKADAGTIKRLTIKNPAGDITVEKSTDGAIRIEPVIVVYHRKKGKAENYAAKVKVTSRETAGKLVVGIDSKRTFPYRRVRVSFKCFIPEDMELDVKNRYGNIDIKDAGRDITIDERYGNLFAKNIASRLNVKSHNGRVRLYDIKDKIQLSSNHSRIKIKNIQSLTLKCSHSNLYAKDVKGDIAITHSGYSDLEIESAGPLNIEARHTKIKLKKITGGAVIENSHDSIYMENIKGDIDIKARDCKIWMNKIAGGSLVIKDSYSHVDIEDISAKDIDVTLDHGDLRLVFADVEERIKIKARHADAELKYPVSTVPAFDITLKNGKIINRTPVKLNIQEERDKLTVDISEGKPRIIVDNEYGDVTLKNSKKAAPAPPEPEKPGKQPVEETKKEG
ncbi:MAG: DUF4097 domain-containing protein [bacterium]|nr:DUF4097 domain-containing protein [bacterium]